MKNTVYMKDLTPRFHGTFSNGKLGTNIMGVSYVPGGEYITLKSGAIVSDCKGTCNGVNCESCEKSCYAVRSYKQYPTVTVNRIENTLQLRENIVQHFEDMKNAIIENNVKIVRYTESGEIETFRQFALLENLARKLPNVKFYLYTKNYAVLREFFDHSVLPENMTVLISIWGDHGIDEWNEFKKYRNVKAFAVNSDLKVSCFCPAYEKDNAGKVHRVVKNSAKCEKCRLCFDSKAKIIGCYEH